MPNNPLKKCFLISNLNPWHNLRPFPLVLSPVTSEETNPTLTVGTFQILEESNTVSPQPPFLQTKQPQFLQSFLVGHIVQALHRPCCPSLDLLQIKQIVILMREKEGLPNIPSSSLTSFPISILLLFHYLLSIFVL